jgi:hypothetical protein
LNQCPSLTNPRVELSDIIIDYIESKKNI